MKKTSKSEENQILEIHDEHNLKQVAQGQRSLT